jgi:hypothetical protein
VEGGTVVAVVVDTDCCCTLMGLDNHFVVAVAPDQIVDAKLAHFDQNQFLVAGKSEKKNN